MPYSLEQYREVAQSEIDRLAARIKATKNEAKKTILMDLHNAIWKHAGRKMCEANKTIANTSLIEYRCSEPDAFCEPPDCIDCEYRINDNYSDDKNPYNEVTLSITKESYDRILELLNNPIPPTQELINLFRGKR